MKKSISLLILYMLCVPALPSEPCGSGGGETSDGAKFPAQMQVVYGKTQSYENCYSTRLGPVIQGACNLGEYAGWVTCADLHILSSVSAPLAQIFRNAINNIQINIHCTTYFSQSFKNVTFWLDNLDPNCNYRLIVKRRTADPYTGSLRRWTSYHTPTKIGGTNRWQYTMTALPVMIASQGRTVRNEDVIEGAEFEAIECQGSSLVRFRDTTKKRFSLAMDKAKIKESLRSVTEDTYDALVVDAGYIMAKLMGFGYAPDKASRLIEGIREQALASVRNNRVEILDTLQFQTINTMEAKFPSSAVAEFQGVYEHCADDANNGTWKSILSGVTDNKGASVKAFAEFEGNAGAGLIVEGEIKIQLKIGGQISYNLIKVDGLNPTSGYGPELKVSGVPYGEVETGALIETQTGFSVSKQLNSKFGQYYDEVSVVLDTKLGN